VSVELEVLKGDLSASHARFLTVASQLESSVRDRSGVCGEWSPKDVVAHLAGWDSALREFVLDPEGFDPSPLYDVDLFNAASVADRRGQPWEETLANLEEGMAQLAHGLLSVTQENRIYGRVCSWLSGRQKDYVHHTNQLETWIS